MKETNRRCPKCGRELMMDDNQCPYCGAELRKSRRIGKWILIPAVLLVIALGAWIFLQNFPLHMGGLFPDSPETSAPQRDALDEALEYLDWGPFSQSKLQRWLEDDGFTPEEAADAIERCGADWNQQALASAEQMLEEQGNSLEGLRHDLDYFEEFTPEQIEWALSHLGEVDWQAQAVFLASGYLESMPMSRIQLAEQLVYEGFSPEDAEYGVEHCGADWEEIALQAVYRYCEPDESPEEVRSFLETYSYTPQEIEFALENR